MIMWLINGGNYVDEMLNVRHDLLMELKNS